MPGPNEDPPVTYVFELHGPLSAAPPTYRCGSRLGRALRDALDQANGAAAYGGAFILLPSGRCDVCWTMEEVNAGEWKRSYPRDVQGAWFFAVDAMGRPFGIRGEEIVHLDLETGKATAVATRLGEFLAKVQADPDEVVCLDYFEEWFEIGRMLELRERLVPRVPLVLGGGGEAAAYVAMDLMESLEDHARLYSQIKDMPSGGKVVLVPGSGRQPGG